MQISFFNKTIFTCRMPHHLIFLMSTPYVSLSGACEYPPIENLVRDPVSFCDSFQPLRTKHQIPLFTLWKWYIRLLLKYSSDVAGETCIFHALADWIIMFSEWKKLCGWERWSYRIYMPMPKYEDHLVPHGRISSYFININHIITPIPCQRKVAKDVCTRTL